MQQIFAWLIVFRYLKRTIFKRLWLYQTFVILLYEKLKERLKEKFSENVFSRFYSFSIYFDFNH